MVKQDIRNLGLQSLRDISTDFSRLRETCEEYRLNIVDFYNILKELETEHKGKGRKIKSLRVRKRKIKRKAGRRTGEPETIEDSIIQTFIYFRQRVGKNTLADYGEFISEVAVDLKKNEIDLDEKVPLSGLVSRVLYEFVESEEFGEDKTRNTVRINRPINSQNLERVLKIKFGDSSFRQIIGELEPGYISERYVFDPISCSIRLKGEGGVLIEDPMIEGCISFEGGSKRTTREHIEELLVSQLCPAIESTMKSHFNSLRQKEEERKSRLGRLGEIDSEIQDLERNNRLIYRFESNKEKNLRELKRSILGNIIDKKEISGREKVDGIEFEIKEQKTSKDREFYMTIEIGGSNSAQLRETFMRSMIGICRENTTDNINLINTSAQRILKKRELLDEEKGSILRELSEIEKKIRDTEDKKRRISGINYLGLEGPGFASYFGLCKALERRGFYLRGTFAEYDLRSYNIMKSIINNIKDVNGSNLGIFRDSFLTRRNIDDWVILDFPINEDIRLFDREVKYKEETLNLGDYHTLLNFLDSSQKQTPKQLSRMFGVSEEFVRAAVERLDRTFDVVFLDYYGDYRDRKNEVLKQLASRRLNDEAIIAITCNRKYAPKNSGAYMGEIGSILHNSGGYNIIGAPPPLSYQDRSTPMLFRIYQVSRIRKL